MTRVLWVEQVDRSELAAALGSLRETLQQGGVQVVTSTSVPVDAAVIWAERPLSPPLLELVLDRRVPVLLAGPTLEAADPDGSLAEAAGLRVAGATPVHDVRVQAGPGAGALAPTGHVHQGISHGGPHVHLTDRVLLVDKTYDDVAVLLQAFVGLDPQPVSTWREDTRVATWLLGSRPGSVRDRQSIRALLGLLRLMTGAPEPAPVRVGLLGYGAIGHEHSRAVRSVDGLELVAVCDQSAERRQAAALAAPGVATTDDADRLLGRDDVDLVVVSTPPSTHADWALRALSRGKHVIVEKPFAIETSQADEVLAVADAAGLLVGVYQNRRYDPDHLAVRQAIRVGQLGEVFHIETFVGGYGHPCNLWHSDAGVSGGAFYDWGSHVLDQILDLISSEVQHVTAVTHKRRWFDVTNADHSRVTLHFEDGVEAEFVHSDLAAALKPRWYVLGTLGAIVGSWRTERVVSRTDIGTLAEDVLAPADSPPQLDLHAADGSVTRLALPTPDPYPFHEELVDRVRLGLPMTVTAAQSRRVLAVMEAARLSADNGSRPVVPR